MSLSNQQPTVYSTTWCPDCHRAKAFLKANNIDFTEVDIEATPGAGDLIAEHNQGKRVVPTFEVGGQFYGNPPLPQLAKLFGVS